MEVLLAICREVGWTFEMMQSPYKYSPTSFQYSYHQYKSRERNALRRLVKRKLVRKRRDGAIVITKKGVTLAVLACMRKGQRPLREGEQCMVVFDIPERYRWLRAEVRKLLREQRYRMLQKSVWVGRTDIADHLLYFAQLNGLGRHVKVFAVRERHLFKK